MNLIYANDKRGQYPDSWYAATATPLDPFPNLKGETTADVCVVGGGYTGLSTALHLAEKGYSVALLEAQRIGFGASGRNGGQVGSGHNMDQQALEKKLGKEDARKLWDIARDSVEMTKKLVAEYVPEANYRPGHVAAYYTGKEAEYAARKRDYLAENYGHETEFLNRADMEALIGNPAYAGGVLDRNAGHLHPLRYAIGLARATVAAGAQIYESAYVHNIREGAKTTVQTESGRVVADHVVLACNGYSNSLARKTAARVMPINNYMVATEPLGDRAKQVLSRDVCVYDSKFVLNYYRLSEDGRLLFGGGESYGVKFPANIEAKVRKPLETLYPQLKDVKIDYAWGGTLGITTSRMPYFARVGNNILTAAGYSGHGVALATLAGEIIAQTIAGQSERFDVLSRVPVMPFPGGRMFSTPILTLAMTWFSLRDRLGI
ncbi:MAG TPA: FAD-binding oxidoreductase [Rhodobacteraceae bacterium]|nr:FAD-binding oxidoreductase [Paracoccaceae bacterium]